MTKTCIICRKRPIPGDITRSFHRFPTNSELKKKWMAAIGIQIVKREDAVCSDHFEYDSYHQSDGYTKIRKRLLSTAVPLYSNSVLKQNTNNIMIPTSIELDTGPKIRSEYKNEYLSSNSLDSSRKKNFSVSDLGNTLETSSCIESYGSNVVTEIASNTDQSFAQPKSTEMTTNDKIVNSERKLSQTDECTLPKKKFCFMEGCHSIHLSRDDFVSNEAWGRFIKLMGYKNRQVSHAERLSWRRGKQITYFKELVKCLQKKIKLATDEYFEMPNLHQPTYERYSDFGISNKTKTENVNDKAEKQEVKNEFEYVEGIKKQDDTYYEVNVEYFDTQSVGEETGKTISETTNTNDAHDTLNNLAKQPDYGISNTEKVTIYEEVEIESEFVKEIKEENNEFDEENIECEYLDFEGLEDADGNEETTVNKAINRQKSDNTFKKNVNEKSAKLTRKDKFYIKTKMNYQNFNKLCTMVMIGNDERRRCEELIKRSEEYLISNYKCNKCLIGFILKLEYEKHLKDYHSESNAYVCELCTTRFSTESSLCKHVSSHNLKYVCSFCNYERLNKKLVYDHVTLVHGLTYKCCVCGMDFGDNHEQFSSHYKLKHMKFICDNCKFVGTTKQQLISHIREYHDKNVCRFCNKTFKKQVYMKTHLALFHTKDVPDEAFCVECHIQYDSVGLYKRHLSTSSKHRPKRGYPCKECSSVYKTKYYLKMHYHYKHLKKTKHYCDKCSRYFISKNRLDRHVATSHHNIVPPKNKICAYCGRGFSSNTILNNHIRTHTGERPFACSHCTATFTQKSAMVTHARAKHKHENSTKK